jgi:hypothetical protein
MRRSISSRKGMPVASQILGYMLMEVKPGMVFTSFRKILPVAFSMKKSTRAMPLSSSARKAAMAMAWNFLTCAGFQFGGDEELGAFFEIFGGVIVEFAVRNDFAWDGGLRIVIAEHGDFDFAGAYGFFHQNFHGEFGGQGYGGREFFTVVDFAHAHGGTEGRGFYEQRIFKLFFDFGSYPDWGRLPIRGDAR